MTSQQRQEQVPRRQTDAKGGMMNKESDIVYPSGFKFALLILSAYSAMFLVSLDKLIISTAIPQITDTFLSKDNIGWYGTAYLLTNCAFQLVFGKLYKFLPAKSTFLFCLLLFQIGSAICGAAPNSIAFIFGRALAGLGAGGVLPGVIVIIVHAVPLHKRPKYQGFFGGIFGLASVLGPTVGGVFTTHVSWRWCFYINLPIGGVVMVIVFFLLHLPDQASTNLTLLDKLRQANVLGFLCLVPGIVCLCLVLQYGGTTYPWNNGRIIALFVLSFLLLICFGIIQVRLPEQAILPPRVFVQRSIASGFWSSLCIGAHQTVFLYYLPIWFQAIEGKSAVESGIDLLPMVLIIAATSIGNGYFISFIGYYMPSLITGVCVTAIGAGLLTTLEVHTSQGKWIGYQILYGFGQGCAAQVANMAAQTVLPKDDVGIGASLMFFGQTLFGAVFVSVGQNVLENQLAKQLASVPGISPDILKGTGATEIINNIGDQYRTPVLQAYNDSLRVVFQVGLCMACLAIPGAMGMEWRSVKRNVLPKTPNDEKAAESGKDQGNVSGQEPAGSEATEVNAGDEIQANREKHEAQVQGRED